jgi:Tat protein translocase TatB subunit
VVHLATVFGIGFGEILVLAIVLLVAVGPKKLPMFFKVVGKTMREFRRATRELRDSVGIDDLLADTDLDLKDPLGLKKKYSPDSKAIPAARPDELTKDDLRREMPLQGADRAHADAQVATPKGPKVESEAEQAPDGDEQASEGDEQGDEQGDEPQDAAAPPDEPAPPVKEQTG